MTIDVEAVQNAARVAWTTFYSQTDSRAVSYKGRGGSLEGCKHQATFQAIARMCLGRNYEIKDYIETCLNVVLAENTMVLPKDLLLPSVTEKFNKEHAKRGEVTGDVALWDYQCSFVQRQQIERPELFTELLPLLYPAIRPFTSWFRVCYPGTPILKIVDEYGAEAWQELNDSPALCKLLSEKRPETIALLQSIYGLFISIQPEGVHNG